MIRCHGHYLGSRDICFWLWMWYWRVKSAKQKLLGLQWEAHVAPHSTCASRCSLGKVVSLPWASPRGQEILFFVMDVVLEGQICYAKAIGTAVGSTCRPAFDMCFPLQFGEGCFAAMGITSGSRDPFFLFWWCICRVKLVTQQLLVCRWDAYVALVSPCFSR